MNLSELGNQIQKRRKELNLRQEDLSEMSGVTVRTIYKIEDGIGNPSVMTLSKLCEILGLELSLNVKQIK